MAKKNKPTKSDVEVVKSQFQIGKRRMKFATAPQMDCQRAVNPERDYERIMNKYYQKYG